MIVIADGIRQVYAYRPDGRFPAYAETSSLPQSIFEIGYGVTRISKYRNTPTPAKVVLKLNSTKNKVLSPNDFAITVGRLEYMVTVTAHALCAAAENA